MGTTTEVREPTVESVEAEVGMGHAAWDTIDPREIIRAVLRLTARTPEPAGDSELTVVRKLRKRLREILDEDDFARRHGERIIVTEARYMAINEADAALERLEKLERER